MIRLARALAAWGTPGFNDTLKDEVEQLDAALLPLQAGLSRSSHVSDSPFRVMVINASEADGMIFATTGVFYAGIIAGCSCADDPTPIEEQAEYCELQFAIQAPTAETRVSLLPE